jgi:hypothetical protein
LHNAIPSEFAQLGRKYVRFCTTPGKFVTQRLMEIEHQLNLLHLITVTEPYSLIIKLSTKTHYGQKFTVKLAIFVTFHAEYNIVTGNL